MHGDDFTFAGSHVGLEWVRSRMEESFLVKMVGRLGGDEGDASAKKAKKEKKDKKSKD